MLAQQTDVFPLVIQMRWVDGVYEVHAGRSLSGAVVTMRKGFPPWKVVSVRPVLRFGPIALAMIAIIAWRLRRDVPRHCYGAMVGAAIAIPTGLAFGFAVEFCLIDPSFPSNASGNMALDLAVQMSVLGCLAGIVVPCFRRGFRFWQFTLPKGAGATVHRVVTVSRGFKWVRPIFRRPHPIRCNGFEAEK